MIANECLFCDFISGKKKATEVFKDEDVAIFMDQYPMNAGHLLLMPVKHYTSLYDIPEEVLCKISEKSKEYALKLKNIQKCDGITILQNNEKSANQSVFHYHMHVIPRFNKDWLEEKVISQLQINKIRKKTDDKELEKLAKMLTVNETT